MNKELPMFIKVRMRWLVFLWLITILSLCKNSYQIPLYLSYSDVNNCNDFNEYYTTAKITDYKILYNVNNTNYIELKYYSYYVLQNLINMYEYIQFYTIIDLDYNILTSCIYKCKLQLGKLQLKSNEKSNEKHNKFLIENVHKLFNIGGYLHMFCNSFGCRWENFTCETYYSRDEL
jgi:hypothetical protein